MWQHRVDQKGRAFGHASPATARTEAAPLATEREQVLARTVRAPKPCEAARQDPAPKVRLELAPDEGGQPGGLGVSGRVARKVGRWALIVR